MRVFSVLAGFLGMVMAFAADNARADIFNLSHFVTPGEFAIGIEPELTFSSGAGMGVNARYTQGLTDFLNLSGELGTGSGPRQFRAGVDLGFDVIPDLSGQPGLGIATRAMFVRVPTPGLEGTGLSSVSGMMELSAMPYIHKSFANGKSLVDPFFSVPVGMSFLDGQYKGLLTAVVGAMIKADDHVWFSSEFGIAINHTESYFAGGVAYYH